MTPPIDPKLVSYTAPLGTFHCPACDDARGFTTHHLTSGEERALCDVCHADIEDFATEDLLRIESTLRAQVTRDLAERGRSLREVQEKLEQAGMPEAHADLLTWRACEHEPWECECGESYHPDIDRCRHCGLDYSEVPDVAAGGLSLDDVGVSPSTFAPTPPPEEPEIYDDPGAGFDEAAQTRSVVVIAVGVSVAILVAVVVYIILWPSWEVDWMLEDAEEQALAGDHAAAIELYEETYSYAVENLGGDAPDERVLPALCDAIWDGALALADAGERDAAIEALGRINKRYYTCSALLQTQEERNTDLTLRAGRVLARRALDDERFDDAAEIFIEYGLSEEGWPRLERASAFNAAGLVAEDASDFVNAARLYEAGESWGRAGDMHRLELNHAEAAPLFERAGRWGDAAQQYDFAGDHANAARAFLKDENWGRASQSYVAAGRIDDAAAIHRDRGDVLSAGSIYADADRLTEAIALYEQGGHAWEAARLYERTEDWPRAIEHYVTEQAWDHVVRVYLAQEPPRVEEAAAVLTEHEQWAALGQMHADRGDTDEAIAAFQRVEDWEAIGQVYMNAERWSDAELTYLRAERPDLATQARLSQIESTLERRFVDTDCASLGTDAELTTQGYCALQSDGFHLAFTHFDAADAHAFAGYAAARATERDPGISIRLRAARSFRDAGARHVADVFYDDAFTIAQRHTNHTSVLEISLETGRVAEGLDFVTDSIDGLLEQGEGFAAFTALGKVFDVLEANKDAVASGLARADSDEGALERLLEMSERAQKLAEAYPEVASISGYNRTEGDRFSGTFIEGRLKNTTNRTIPSVTIRVELFEKDLSLCPYRCNNAPAGFEEDIVVRDIPPQSTKPFRQMLSNRAPYTKFSETLIRLRRR